MSLALGVFSLVMAEFLPVSLLTPIAADLGVSTGTAGQTVTATALIGAIAAPTIPLLTRRLDRRVVMLGLTALLVASNLIAMTTSSLAGLLVARVLLGIALGGFWALSAALAMRLVPAGLFARAMATILTGVSVATVSAAPLGAWMGGHWGWHSPFVVATVASVVTLAVQALTLPPLAPLARPDLAVLGRLLTRPAIRRALMVVVLVIAGHFAGFTYVRPLLEGLAGLSVGAISAVLLGYGIGGFVGNLVFSAIAGRSDRQALVIGAALVAALAAVLVLTGTVPVVAASAIVLWGFAFGAFPVGFQLWILRVAPDQTEAASGLLVTAFQVAIALGALGGGLLVDGIGPRGAPLFAVVAVTIGLGLVIASPKAAR